MKRIQEEEEEVAICYLHCLGLCGSTVLICISSCVEFHTQKVEEMQISDMLKSEDILENVQAFQVRSC